MILIKHNQKIDAKILQMSHRLEKGLTISSPRALWGWDKAYTLLSLVEKTDNSFSKETGLSVLKAFIQHKLNSSNLDDKTKSIVFKERLSCYSVDDLNQGGAISITKDDVVNIDYDAAQKIFNSRHSVRDYDGTPVDVEKIMEAIKLANRCPSACNRQPYKVYVVDDEKWKQVRNDGNQVYGADKHLVITADISSYNLDEYNDWIVSASIFAGYLSLALTVVGIGSCVIRKSMVYNKTIEKLKEGLCIPQNEKIIIEIAVGNYKDRFKIAYSNRKNLSDLVQVIR